MSWQMRIVVLVLVGLPAFTGVSPLSLLGDVLPGVPWSAFVYAAVVNLTVLLIGGAAFATGALAVSALILLPVVLAGATITWGMSWFVSYPPEALGTYGAHYVRLALNMLAVIPLALGIVASIPFNRLEQYLLTDPRGVAAWEKKLLMAVRVFNHIAFFVIPGLLEVAREEWPYGPSRPETASSGKRAGRWALITGLVQFAIAGICGALRFIPLWAREIADLPDRPPQQNRRSR
ncbi:MAG: hypothetical protein QNI97_00455 [Desulfobacterales bacterium]|nr:hypothetical protein [Desulfobacterales bacterium]